MPEVRLVDLDVIKRYSLLVRHDAAPADELLASLDASREVVLAALAEAQPPTRARRGRAVRAARAVRPVPAVRAVGADEGPSS
jgi:hypothetical protein